MLRAELLGDQASWRELMELHRSQEQARLYVTPVAFVMAALIRFSAVADLREVTRFVSRYNAVVPLEDRLPPREVESMLWTALGETHLADLVKVELRGEIGHSMLFALIDDLGMSNKEIDALLAAAENAVLDAVQKGEVEPLPEALRDAPVISRHRPRRRPGMRQSDGMAAGRDDAAKRGS